jgi:hypothetical protein
MVATGEINESTPSPDVKNKAAVELGAWAGTRGLPVGRQVSARKSQKKPQLSAGALKSLDDFRFGSQS